MVVPVHGGIHAFKIHVNTSALPVRRQCKDVTVQTNGIIDRGRFGQIPRIADPLVAKLPCKFLGCVGIDGMIIALCLPDGGHKNPIPSRTVKIRAIKIELYG